MGVQCASTKFLKTLRRHYGPTSSSAYTIHHGMWYVVCGIWYVVCGMWYVVCGMWYVYHRPHTTYHIPHTTYHIPHTTYHIPHTTYHGVWYGVWCMELAGDVVCGMWYMVCGTH